MKSAIREACINLNRIDVQYSVYNPTIPQPVGYVIYSAFSIIHRLGVDKIFKLNKCLSSISVFLPRKRNFFSSSHFVHKSEELVSTLYVLSRVKHILVSLRRINSTISDSTCVGKLYFFSSLCQCFSLRALSHILYSFANYSILFSFQIGCFFSCLVTVHCSFFYFSF